MTSRVKYPYQVVLARAHNLSYDDWIVQWREFSTWCDLNIGQGRDAWEFYRDSSTNTFMFTQPESRTAFLLRFGASK